jgi:hypothetical protein
MIKRSHFVVLLASIVFLLFVYFYVTSQKNILHKTSDQTNVTWTTIASSTKYSVVKGSYPQFSNGTDEFNGSIRDVINQGIADHLKSSQDNWNARFETALPSENIKEFPSESQKFEFSIATTTIVRNDKAIISFVIYIYEFSGGAHGSQSILTFNFNLETKKEITIEDYIDSDVTFLKKLSDQSRKLLLDKMVATKGVTVDQINRNMLNEGTTPLKGNFSLFTLPSDNRMTFYFTQYQVAPYVFGSFDVAVDLPLK